DESERCSIKLFKIRFRHSKRGVFHETALRIVVAHFAADSSYRTNGSTGRLGLVANGSTDRLGLVHR
ncbi:hypothetical protein PMAYCL1PPCAC_32358, partial [Pristionchus mayeri]